MSSNEPEPNTNSEKTEVKLTADNPSEPPKKDSTYTADNIIVLEGLEGVRKRPSMYIGSTGKRGWHHLFYEIIDNSIDESLAGFCTHVEVFLEKDNSIRVRDNGRGIPVSVHPVKKVPTIEVIFTSLHTGGKFDKNSYKVSGGLHGVGLSVVNACSEWVIVKVRRDGKQYQVKFGQGKILEHVNESPLDSDNVGTGTEIQFYPDKKIFEELNNQPDGLVFDYEIIAGRLRDLAFLNPIKITLTDNRFNEPKVEVFQSNGIMDFVRYLNQGKKPLHSEPIHFTKTKDDYIVDIALQYNETYAELIQCYVNNINTIEGGTHLTGFKLALTKLFNDYIHEHKEFKASEDKPFKGSDVREGLVAVISMKVPEPQFEGQTKTKLGNAAVQSVVSDITFEEVYHYFDSHPQEVEPIISKVLLAQRARIASQKAREATRRKTALDGLRLPGKLADCSSRNAEESEIFIVEGDSAGGSAKQGRNREFQAILPLRGKILNVEKARLGKMFENKEIVAMIKAIGSGFTDAEDETNFNIENLRYHKIIIMTDADVDGAHIKTLLLTFFFRYMRPLIDTGHIFAAVPPIYKLTYRKEARYLYNEAGLMDELKKFCTENKIADQEKVKVQRYKGLGEMNPEELWETTMDPKTRLLLRMNYEDFVTADNIFTMLMGEEVEPRKKFIVEHYHEVMNLDI